MHLTPRELDKLMIHTLADVALKRKAKGLKLNHPETVAVRKPAPGRPSKKSWPKPAKSSPATTSWKVWSK